MLAQNPEEGGAVEEEDEEEDPDVVLVRVERPEEADPTASLSIQEGEWSAVGLTSPVLFFLRTLLSFNF